jgi:hypothetical protein
MLTDDELVGGFEAATLASFPHVDHVRLTIIYLNRFGREKTEQKLFDGLRRFAAAKGVPEKFHVTMTVAWIELVTAARAQHPGLTDSAALVAACPQLLDRDLPLRFYTPERLNSPEAKAAFIPPDRAIRLPRALSLEP